MQALAGRLVESRHLRMTGDITWNGRHADEVVLPRSAALVDQNDNHIPMLTVRETLEFANVCQVSPTTRNHTGLHVTS
jgi:ABC-type multidrug transport system ATPase subunit